MVINNNYLVAIPICVYNHEHFLRKTIEGIVSQKTSFSFFILIGDDCSTDDSIKIIEEYYTKYSNIYFYRNHVNIGASENSKKIFSLIHTKYVALCDGDDYWIDPYKLQKQVDFLEQHPEIFICGTNTKVIYEDGTPSHLFNISPRVEITEERLLPIEQLISPLVPFHTSSVMFRKITTFPSWFSSINNGDIAIFFLCALRGKVGVLPDVTSVYRRHATGITTTYLKDSVDTRSYLTLYHLLDKESERAYHHLFRPLIFDFMVNHISALLREKKFRLARIT
ncbi:MAG: glycosyltransferase, partial [Bacteroidetes bacterium]|nr:glycosyltransferase [Bacteroidota bacterium]